MKNYRVLLFYKYVFFEDPEGFKNEHLAFCLANDIKGRVFIANEGINGTVSGTVDNILKYKEHLTTFPEFSDITFKEDEEEMHAHKKMYVRVRKEIVYSSLGNVSLKYSGKRLPPDELLKFYEENKDFVIIDARNRYETSIGKFKNAITLGLKSFRDWPEAVKDLEQYKDKTIVTYCTGGVRCEKASAYLLRQGFKDVYQLDGGIVSFAKKYPDTYWQGGVFVFDERRVVEPNQTEELKTIAKCYFCGKPSSYYINCHNLDCDRILITCHECKVRNDYCCSDACRESTNKRDKYYG